MSGGHFDYKQYAINDIANELEELIKLNDVTEEAWQWPPDIMIEFERALIVMKTASVYAQRIDWLVSGDDDVKAFRKRLKEDLKAITDV